MVRERNRQIILNQYLRESKMRGYFELKIAKGNTFNFSDMEENQYEGLQATEHDGLVWKLSDDDRRKKPCDTLSIPEMPSYLVIQFARIVYFIRIMEIVKLREAGEVSISQEKCKEVAEKVLHS